MAYVVIQKSPPGPEMHVLKNGNLSLYGKPHRFLSKLSAQEVAREWAQVNANCGFGNKKMIVREVK